MKKIVRILTVLSVLLIAQWNLQAQRPYPGPPNRGPGLEKFVEELGITDDQKAELKALHESHRAEAEALMDQEFASPEAHRKAMDGLRDTHQKAIEAILTEAQLEKLAALKTEAQTERKENREANTANHQAMRKEMESYRETEILPVLREQRSKLETQLSAEDKATIAVMRAKMAAHMKARPAPGPGPGAHGKRPEITEEQRAEMQADREKIKALVEKYDSQIAALLDEIKDERESWEENRKEIGEKYAPENREARPGREGKGKSQGERAGTEKRAERPGKGMDGHYHRSPMEKDMGKVGFLLLDPNGETTSTTPNKAAFAEMQVFPNPSSNRNTVSYQLKAAGNYRVELRDKDGLVLQVLSNEYRQPGSYKEEIDLSKYAAGTYYVSIVGAEGVVSKKVVVAK